MAFFFFFWPKELFALSGGPAFRQSEYPFVNGPVQAAVSLPSSGSRAGPVLSCQRLTRALSAGSFLPRTDFENTACAQPAAKAGRSRHIVSLPPLTFPSHAEGYLSFCAKEHENLLPGDLWGHPDLQDIFSFRTSECPGRERPALWLSNENLRFVSSSALREFPFLAACPLHDAKALSVTSYEGVAAYDLKGHLSGISPSRV